jgi:signal transduction histidine kinase
MALELKPIDLAAVCRPVVEELETNTAYTFACEYLGDLTGTWDAARLGQVVSNIAGNAVTHGAEGIISISVKDEGDTVSLSVSNYGETISQDAMCSIFSAFRHGKGRRTGLGLGLYISREIVLVHNGTIDVSSEDGKTIFSIRLPREVTHEK